MYPTVWPGDLAPDDPYLASPDLLGCPVDESDLLSEVETAVRVRPKCPLHISNVESYVAALGSSTPSILTNEVLGLVLRLPRW